MYIAGIHLPEERIFSIDALAAASTCLVTFGMFRETAKASKKSEKGAGEIVKLPTTFIGKAITPIHALAFSTPFLSLPISTILNGFHLPQWFVSWSLPDFGLGETEIKALRVLGCFGFAVGFALSRHTLRELDTQFHFIGVCDIHIQ